MRLLLRADSGGSIGVGHVSRCVGFAEEAAARGWTAGFAGEVGGHFAEALDCLGVHRIPVNQVIDWDADVVLVDHYAIGEIRATVHAAGALLVSVEDGPFGRRAADVVVDCGLVRHERADDGSSLVLAGPEYAPLRAGVRAARARRAASPPAGDPQKVLVALGGSVATGVLDAVLTAVRRVDVPVLVRAFSPTETVVRQRFPGIEGITVEPPTPSLPELAAGADLVISAAGMTLLELCCIGVPVAVVLLADNQRPSYAAAVDRRWAVGLGAAPELVADPSTAVAALRPLLVDPEERAQRAVPAATDGLGAARVLDTVARLIRGAS